MVAVQRGLLLTPELRSVFDFSIIDPSTLLVELGKFAALGDSIYVFAITLLLYRAVRPTKARPSVRTHSQIVRIKGGDEAISLTTITLHLIVLLARSFDSSRSAIHPTLYRRVLTKYEYVVTVLTLIVVLARCRRRITRSRLTHAFAHSFVYYLFPSFWFSFCATHHPWVLYPSYQLQFVARTVAPHPNAPNSEPWSWDSAGMACTPTLPYCRVLWTFAHALAAVAELPQLLRLYESGRRSVASGKLVLHSEKHDDDLKTECAGRDEGVLVYVSLVALSRFFFLPSYIAIFDLTKMYDPILYLSQLLHVSIFGVFVIAMLFQGLRNYSEEEHPRADLNDGRVWSKEHEALTDHFGAATSMHLDRTPLRERLQH